MFGTPMINIFVSWLVSWSPLFIAIVFFWIVWHIVITAFLRGA